LCPGDKDEDAVAPTMVFLATTPELEHISRRVMALSARSKVEGISRPPLASGTTAAPDPRVNLPDASRFCREACADWTWFFPTLPIFEMEAEAVAAKP
jgi:hypothetical protein